jgi:hypothetical protein
MAGSKLFSGPPSNKATASTLAAAAATLFWTIAAHTFWKSMNVADLTLYISTSTVLLTAIVGFVVPESAAYTDHSKKRLVTQAAAQDSTSTIISAITDLGAKVDRLSIASTPAISADGPTATPGPTLTQSR